ncbi:hypoxanthine phosphoribosyltransferase-like [Bradysia coprophila]|uniref:hypoxanthine phosphoribosyltransferase-like n=1 Tax=Bradysia coprophila TaxID=38358 RepID=UPI00187DA263|nr:hypoxanthine phosphoribosyltransferase-like [Bradysia coprophila]
MDAHRNGGKCEKPKENGFSTILKRTRITSLTDEETHELPGTCPAWSDNLRAVLFTDTEIQSQVQKLARQICRDYQGRSVICVGLLSGAMVFLADLLRHFTIPYKVDFMVVSSYGAATTSSGSIRLKKDMSLDPNGMDVLIIEDLIDTGNTLQWIKTHLSGKGCASIKMCCLLDKKERRTVPITADYVGFECPDEFIVGYGMDYAEDYRCLPFIGVLKPKAFMNS